jgi:hypothetical protein
MWTRRLIAAFWTSALVTWLWAMPGLPFGLTDGDYNRRVVPVLALGGASTLIAAAALLLRAKVSHSHTELRRLAFYDPLTGVANGALFLDRLE